MNILVIRRWSAPDNAQYRATTTGTLSMNGQQFCFTLEPTALMIPEGTYPVKMMPSARFNRETPHIDVPGRVAIEIHGVNYATDSEGCIGVGVYRLSEYDIYDTPPATSGIETALAEAEKNGETNTITVQSDIGAVNQ